MATNESPSPESAPLVPGAAPVEGAAPSTWELFLDAHYKKLLIAGAALIVAIFVGIIIQSLARARSNAAATAFSSATTIAEYEAVSRDHRGTPAGGNALLMKADLELKEGKLSESQATLTSFIASYPDHPLQDQSLFALGVQAAQKGDLDEAESYFQQVIDDDNAIDLAPLAVIRTGDIAYERGNYDEARDLYESVNPTYPGTPYGIIAQQKLQRKALRPPALKPAPDSATTVPISAPIPIPPASAGNPGPVKVSVPVTVGAPAVEESGTKSEPATKPSPASEKAKPKGKGNAPAGKGNAPAAAEKPAKNEPASPTKPSSTSAAPATPKTEKPSE